MKKVHILLIFCLVGILIPDKAKSISASIVINEVQIAGSTVDEEFIELHNLTSSAIDLSALVLRLHIRSSTGTDSHRPLTFGSSTIPADGYYLIGPYNSGLALDATYSSSGQKLVSNGALYISTSATATVDILDMVGWGSQPSGGFEGSAYGSSPLAYESIGRANTSDTDSNFSDFTKTNLPTPGEQNTFGVTPGPEPSPTSYPTLVLNELMPNPKGTDADGEFVEIYNSHTFAVSLKGWKLADSNSKPAEIKWPKDSIAPKSYLSTTQKNFSLNNSNGDKLYLYSPDGKKISSVSYSGDAKEGWSYALSGAKWLWTSKPTPTAKNIFETTGAAPTSSDRSTVTTSTDPKITTIPIDTKIGEINVGSEDSKYGVMGFSLFAGATLIAVLSAAYYSRHHLRKIGERIGRRIQKL